MQPTNMVWTFVGLGLTLLVIVGYFIGKNNPLFRLVSYPFVGITAGYLVVVILYQVLWPRLVRPLAAGTWSERALAIVPLVLCLLMLTRLIPGMNLGSSISLGYLVGVTAAVIVGGAVLGTLFQQGLAAINFFDLGAAPAGSTPWMQLLEGVFLLGGTLATLAYFYYGAKARPDQPPRRPVVIEALAKVGEVFIAITLGALFAGVLAAASTALIERLDFIWSVIRNLVG